MDWTFEEMKLSRIDCCLDCFPQNQTYSDEMLRIVRRSPYMKSYRERKFSKSIPRHKEKNNHSWRIECKTVAITVYDKEFQLLEEELAEEPSGPMLRIEVARKSASFKRGLSKEIKGNNSKILRTIMEESESTIKKYLKTIYTGSSYVKYKQCIELVKDQVKNKRTLENMLQLAEKLAKCKSFSQAVENSGLSNSQLQTVRKHFISLGISPITLRNSSSLETIKSPVL